MDELKISVDVGLDEKAQSSINKDLSKLKATMPVKLQIENINSIKNQLKDISFKINVDDASFNGLQTKAKKVTADIQNELKKIQNIDFGKTLSQNNTNTKSLGLQIYNTDYVKKQVNEVLNIVKQTKPVISKELNELNSFQLKNNVKANTSNLFSGLKQDLTQTKSLLKDFNQDTSREMKIINSTLNSMSSSKIIDVNQIKVQTEQGVKALEQASYKIASTKKSFDSKLVAQENKILQGQINNFLNNPRLNKNARDNYAKILQELNDNPETRQGLTANKKIFKTVQQQAISNGELEISKIDALGSKFKNVGVNMISGAVIAGSVAGLHQMYHSILDIDTAMTDLKKVTNGTDEIYRNFLNNSINQAERLKGKVSDVIQASAEWAKLGYSMSDASKLAEVNMLYKNVGDVDMATGTRDMVSVMKAYKLEAGEVINVLDKYNEISNNFSISMAGIGEGIRRSASAMKLAGNDLDETLGLLVAGNNVIQDPAIVGTFLKTASMRLRGASGLTAKMRAIVNEEGLDMEGTLDTHSQTQAKINKLTEGKVDIMKDANTFKSTYEILKDISNIWDEITDKNRAELVEIIGGNEHHNALYVQKCA